ncbi:MAG: 16S rRNA (guanine(966)-N(2))-methyltransferase RsmD [Solirubrobacteraceae bacterium]
MRVVAGELRSRRLHTVPGNDTRPTSDRARAGLFDWLGPTVDGARVLDLYAGTGALGIEALSRGAREAVFVERARAAVRVLRRNLEELGLEGRSRVVEADLARGLRPLAAKLGAFGLVLADPPYAGAALARLLEDEALESLLDADGSVLVERSARVESGPGPTALHLRGTKRYGETAFDWWERAASPAAANLPEASEASA